MKVAQTDFKKLPEELADQRDQQEKLDKCADSFVAVFAAGELTGFFSNQGLRRNDAVSEADWASPVCTLACWRGRLDIEGKSRVIFINEAAFSKWLSGVRKGGGKPRTKPGRPRVQGVLAENAIRALYPKGGADGVKLEVLWSQVKEHIKSDTIGRETVRLALMRIIAKNVNS